MTEQAVTPRRPEHILMRVVTWGMEHRPAFESLLAGCVPGGWVFSSLGAFVLACQGGERAAAASGCCGGGLQGRRDAGAAGEVWGYL